MSMSNTIPIEKNSWVQGDMLAFEANRKSGTSKIAQIDFYTVGPWESISCIFTNTSEAFSYNEKQLYLFNRLLQEFDSTCSNDVRQKRNLELLCDMRKMQSQEDDDYVSEKAINNAALIVFQLPVQPSLFKTAEDSIHMQFEKEDRSYLEFEVFKDRITCMIVPKRDYDMAMFPDVSLDELESINKIVEDFYGAT